MNKAFYIDFIRQIIEQSLLKEHIRTPRFVGGANQIGLFSFYEQLVERDEVDRYVEKFNELAHQQNRMSLIANGILSSPENPTITNLNKQLIVPLSYICAFRIALRDRDLMLETINNLISIHKGRKVDIAEFDNGKLFMVGTLGNNVDGVPQVSYGDFIGVKTNTSQTVNAFITNRLNTLTNTYGFSTTYLFSWSTAYLYYEESGKLKVAYYHQVGGTYQWDNIEDDGTNGDIIFPPSHNSFTKYKVSLSFDALRCDTPSSLNGDEIISISFSGNATITNYKVMLGNDLTKVSISMDKRKEATGTIILNQIEHYLEPLEMPSSNNADSELNKLMSNHFVANSHTDSLTLSMQYTFILDRSDDLLNALFKYGRYGNQGSGTYTITPNVIYKIKELYSEWGDIDINTYYGKIVESIDIENTESDTLTIALPLQIQGAND